VDSSFLRKLRREIAASPKKAGLLAVLSVVGVWFWAPIVTKWFFKNETPTGDAARSVGNLPPSPTTAASSQVMNSVPSSTPQPSNSIKSRLPARPWRQLVTLMERDARMSPATELIAARDPFKVPTIEMPASKKREEAVVEKPDLTPASAGLVLNSTIVGPGEKRALIGGEIYEEGGMLAATGGEIWFRIVEIRPREVILERKGRLYTLDLPKNEWTKGR
jgi:hypothetical protein